MLQSYSGSGQHSCLMVMSTLQIVKMRSALPGGISPVASPCHQAPMNLWQGQVE